jgi:hypothetical protein
MRFHASCDPDGVEARAHRCKGVVPGMLFESHRRLTAWRPGLLLWLCHGPALYTLRTEPCRGVGCR